MGKLDLDGPYGWGKVTELHLREITSKLSELEKFSWAQLDKHRHHPIARENLGADARKRLREIKQDDVDVLHTLRLAGTRRVWGILVGNVYYVLWWDPGHKVYPVEKKHT